jgi:Mg2+ and Co2+ transporter CorA
MADAYFNGIASEFKSIRVFVSELESKTETVLGLLFNNMRSANDRLLVANGDAMRQILAATSAEAKLSRKMAKQSQKMAVDMRRDSTSMKTIAIMTMFFLPATSFAAVLSMPFFSQSPWMGKIDRAWLWVALSIPSTAIAFAVFYMCTRRGDREIERNHDVELDSVEEQA